MKKKAVLVGATTTIGAIVSVFILLGTYGIPPVGATTTTSVYLTIADRVVTTENDCADWTYKPTTCTSCAFGGNMTSDINPGPWFVYICSDVITAHGGIIHWKATFLNLTAQLNGKNNNDCPGCPFFTVNISTPYGVLYPGQSTDIIFGFNNMWTDYAFEVYQIAYITGYYNGVKTNVVSIGYSGWG